IVDAVGTEVTPSALDKEDLAAELAWVVAVYRGSVVRTNRGLAKDRTRRMTNIRNAARQTMSTLLPPHWPHPNRRPRRRNIFNERDLARALPAAQRTGRRARLQTSPQ